MRGVIKVLDIYDECPICLLPLGGMTSMINDQWSSLHAVIGCAEVASCCGLTREMEPKRLAHTAASIWQTKTWTVTKTLMMTSLEVEGMEEDLV